MPAEPPWVSRLQPESAEKPLVAASHPPLLAETTDVVGPGAVAWAIDLGTRMAAEIIAEEPTLGGSEEAAETLRMGTESATLYALLVVASGDDSLARLTQEGLEGDRDFARRGIRLDRVLRGVRIGHALMTRELLAAVAALVPEEDRVEEMSRVSDLLFAFIDVYSSRMAEEYLAEHDRWVTSAAAERAALVDHLLAGRPAPSDASRTLGYALDRRHVAMVLWHAPGYESSPGALQRTASRLLREHGCTAALEVPHGTATLWAWGAWRSREDVVTDPDLIGGEGVNVAVGTTATGIDGFRRTHLEALRVADLVRPRTSDPAGIVVRYHDVELAVLLAQDPEGARALVERELGETAAATTAAGEMRETVAAYLRHDRSLVRAGEELHVARNTVAYRVKKFEETTGRDVGDRRLELEAALRLLAFLGP